MINYYDFLLSISMPIKSIAFNISRNNHHPLLFCLQALLCYWVSTNAISLVQVSFLKIPAVREKFGIDAVRKYNPGDLPVKKKGFMDSAKDCKRNMRLYILIGIELK